MLSFLKYLCVVCKFFWWCCDHYEESDSSSGYFCLWRNFWIPNPYKKQQQPRIDQWERRRRRNWPIRGRERSTLPAVNWAGEFWILPDWKDGRKVICLKKMFAVNPRVGSGFLNFLENRNYGCSASKFLGCAFHSNLIIDSFRFHKNAFRSCFDVSDTHKHTKASHLI